MKQLIQDPEVKIAGGKISIAAGGGILTAITLNQWVAIATLIYVVLQIGLLIPKYIRLWKNRKEK